MENETYMLDAKQYYTLYCKAFARLDEICCLAEQTMKELEELQLAMADGEGTCQMIPFPKRKGSESEE